MLKYMLATNIAIYTIKNRPPELREAFKAHNGKMCIPTVTLMELLYGAEASASVHRNLRDVEAFAARLDVLTYDSQAAGHARSRGLVVVANNARQFEDVPGIRVANWVN